MSERIIESVGILTKKEFLATVTTEIKSNSLVLETDKPFPGYYIRHDGPYDKDPYSLFAITKLLYNDERIIRCVQKIKKEHNYTFDGAPASVYYQNKLYNAVRFKEVGYQQIGEIVDKFKNEGLEFRRARQVNSFETIIKVRKYFSMKETLEGIYQDMTDTHTNYIVLPLNLRWNSFEKITMDMKYNIDDKNFDAAQTSVFAKEGLVDFVRIYDREICQGKLLTIKEKYLEAIDKL